MTGEMEIRFAGKEDLENIAGLYVRNHKTAYRGLLSDEYLNGLTVSGALEKWEKHLQDGVSVIWVACERDHFLGFAAAMPDPKTEQAWYLESLHVTENARGIGVGTALIKTAAQYAYDHGYRKMSVCIVRGNDRAGSLYQRLGAEHASFFEDDFNGTVSASERLVWKEVPLQFPDREAQQ